jgi:aminoglycoside/choline kinase family phosphotransferase
MRDLPALWTSQPWRHEAHAWIDASVEATGARLTGPVEEHAVRFWSVVLRAETDRGRVWFKQNAPSQAFEAVLMEEVSAVAPDRVPPVLAVDRDRGWLLTADVGEPVGAQRPDDDGAAAAEVAAVAQSWSALQRRLAGREAAMRRARVPAFEDWNAIPYAVALADSLAALPEGDGRRLDPDGRRAVDAGLERLGEDAARLEASGIPESVEHNDLHLWNAMRGRDGGFAFIDLGDAVWSHPFGSLRILDWVMRSRLPYPPGTPEHDHLVDAYLEPWTDLAPARELRRLLPAAERMSCLHRAESWRRLMADVPLDVVEDEWLDAAGYWLLAASAADPYAATRD